MSASYPHRTGLVAELRDPEALLEAIRALRRDGIRRLDAHVPYPVEGLEEALRLRRSRLPWLIGAFGLLGAVASYALMWWVGAVEMTRNVGGRPPHAAPAFVPIAFETAVLLAGIAGFAAYWLVGGMPRLWDPLFEVDGFESASVDGYWVEIDASDPHFDEERARATLQESGAVRIARLGDRGEDR